MRRFSLLPDHGPAIGGNRMEPQGDTDLHCHAHVELVLVSGGAGRHVCAEGDWPLRRGDVFVVPVGMAHGYAGCHGLSLRNLGYDPIRLDLPLARLAGLPGYRALSLIEPRLRRRQDFAGHLHLDEANLERALVLVDVIEEELRLRQPGWETSATAALLQLLIRLARRYADLAQPQARQALHLAAIDAWIDEHLAERLSLARLARVAGCSVPTLGRQMRAVHGCGPIAHVTALRVARARALLSAGHTVGEVARRSGFASGSYLARVFRRQIGQAPRRWRAGG